jgi:DNA-binding Lrp family transcriptional regulator
VDSIDRHIVDVLLEDGRAPYARIGTRVGLSVAATKRRVDRLVRDGVIRGFTARVDPQVLGWTLEANVQLFTTGTVSFSTMRRDLLRIPEIVDASTVSDPLTRCCASSQRTRATSNESSAPCAACRTSTRPTPSLLLSRLLNRPIGDPAVSRN